MIKRDDCSHNSIIYYEDEMHQVYLGGTGYMYLVHLNGKDYLFKPAYRKNSFEIEKFRGIVQECAYHVQCLIDYPSAIRCFYVECCNPVIGNSVVGAIQDKIETLPNAIDYGRIQDRYIHKLPPSVINQFLREFSTDYLLCNFDAHGGNFITDVNGVVRGIDKEQSFRYLDDDRAQKPSINYSPNTELYGEREPIYNTIFRAYINGKIDIDFDIIRKYTAKIDSVSDEFYRTLFQSYCDACYEYFGSDPIAKSNKILKRKQDMSDNMEEFFEKLIVMRDDKLKNGGGKVYGKYWKT